MSADDLFGLLDLFGSVGVHVWIDGGWAVDAALGRETRPHADLDIVIEERQRDAAVTALRNRGYVAVDRDDTRPWNFVLGDRDGHEVDFHVIRLDEDGNGVYGPAENRDLWPASALDAWGTIAGRRVRSTSPRWLVASHTGYPLTDKDVADVMALCEQFGIEVPSEYARLRDGSGLAAHPGMAHVPHSGGA